MSSTLSDNVLILGAGASVTAGIPTLASFMTLILDVAERGSYKGKELSEEDKKIFEGAREARNYLNTFHGRARFNDENIEDVLSILTFLSKTGKRQAKKHKLALERAISKAIKITSNTKILLSQNIIPECASEPHITFWNAIIDLWENGSTPPTIITFNYDSVLEASLHYAIVKRKIRCPTKTPFSTYSINNAFNNENKIIYKYGAITHNFVGGTPAQHGHQGIASEKSSSHFEVTILKLHGSTSFSKDSTGRFWESRIHHDPIIMPPIFDKTTNRELTEAWAIASENIEKCRNLVFCGYSLPKTDIYMNYFIKSSCGPNTRLNRIRVFDILNSQESESAEALKSRFRECFSEQMRDRIIFEASRALPNNIQPGSFGHLAHSIHTDPDSMLFI